MPAAGDDIIDIAGGGLSERGVAILQAVSRVEEAELTLRVRVRSQMRLGSSDPQALRLIARGEREGFAVRPRDVGRTLAMTSAAVTAITDRLVSARFVEKRGDPSDGRGRVLVLTGEGREQFEAAFGATRRSLHELLESLEESDAAHIVELLGSVADALELVGV